MSRKAIMLIRLLLIAILGMLVIYKSLLGTTEHDYYYLFGLVFGGLMSVLIMREQWLLSLDQIKMKHFHVILRDLLMSKTFLVSLFVVAPILILLVHRFHLNSDVVANTILCAVFSFVFLYEGNRSAYKWNRADHS